MSSTSSARPAGGRLVLPWLSAAVVLVAFLVTVAAGTAWVTWVAGGVAVVVAAAAAVLTRRRVARDRAELERRSRAQHQAETRADEWSRVVESVLQEQLPAYLTNKPAPSLPKLWEGSPAQLALDEAVATLRLLRERRDAAVEVSVRALGRKVQASAHRIQEEAARMVQRHPTDADILATSMRVDHAAAQQARQASGLATLSGQAPGQLWNDPLPLPDVVRAAAGRITAFRRVDVSGDPALAVTPGVAEPLIHLVAELLANATQSSPPSTQVVVVLRQVQRGAVIEIDDGGVGLDPKRLADVREIAAGRTVVGLADLGEIPQMGLAIVGTYARKYGFRVDLSESVYGGLRAVVLVPSDLTETVLPAPALPSPVEPPASVPADDAWPESLGDVPVTPAAPAPEAPAPTTPAGAGQPGLPQRRSRRATSDVPPTTDSVPAVARDITAMQTAEEAGAWMGAFFAGDAGRDTTERPAPADTPTEDR